MSKKLLLFIMIGFSCALSTPDLSENITNLPVIEIDTTTASTTDVPLTTKTTPTTPTTTTTSPPPTTTSSAPTTISPTPVPTPEPSINNWSYTDEKTNQTCTIIQIAIQLNFTYETRNGTPLNVLYNVPEIESSHLNGTCGNETESITVGWGPNNTTVHTLQLEFSRNVITSEFSLADMNFKINASAEYANAKDQQIINLYYMGAIFTTPISMSYHCARIQMLNLTSSPTDMENVAGTVSLSHVQFEAFHKGHDTQFSTAKDCDAIDTPDIVPIVVGCTLAALALAVLIAYLIGRRRTQVRGYMSM